MNTRKFSNILLRILSLSKRDSPADPPPGQRRLGRRYENRPERHKIPQVLLYKLPVFLYNTVVKEIFVKMENVSWH